MDYLKKYYKEIIVGLGIWVTVVLILVASFYVFFELGEKLPEQTRIQVYLVAGVVWVGSAVFGCALAICNREKK